MKKVGKYTINNLGYWLMLLAILLSPLFAYRIPISGLVTLSFTKIILVIILLLILVKILDNYKLKMNRNIINISNSFLYFMLINIFIMLNTQNLGYSIKMLFLISTVFIFAVLISLLFKTPNQIKNLIRVLLFSSICIAILSLWQASQFYIFGQMPSLPFIEYFPLPHEDSQLHRSFVWLVPGAIIRLAGTLSEPNSYGLFLSICLVISLFVIVNRRIVNDNNLFKISVICLIINTLPLLLTFSRSAWLTTILGISYVFFFSKNLKLYLKLTSIFLLILLITFNTVGSSEFTDALFQRVTIENTEGHVNVRLSALNSYFMESPIIGIGFGNYGILEGNAFGVSSTHSYYITYLVEGGILGFMGICLFLFHIYIVIHNKVFRKRYNHFLLRLAYIIFIMILFNNIFYHTLWLETTWVAIGLCFAILNLDDR